MPAAPTPRNINPRPRGALASVAGRVFDSSGRPVPRAIVHVVGESTSRTAVSDGQGLFSIEGVMPGDVIITAEKHGLIDGAYGRRRPMGLALPVALTASQSLDGADIELFKRTVITGMVIDEGRAPIAGARIVALRRQFVAGAARIEPVAFDETDDEGRYRIWDLEPGEYVLVAPATSATVPPHVAPGDFFERLVRRSPFVEAVRGIYPTHFYPATTRAILALVVDLGPGEVRYGVDFLLSPVPAFEVTGRLDGPAAVVQRRPLRLVNVEDDIDTGYDSAVTLTDERGRFFFSGVPPGAYRLEMDPIPAEDGAAVFADHDVLVADENVSGLDVPVRPAATIGGTVALLTDGADIDTGRPITITIEPTAKNLSPRVEVPADVLSAFVSPALKPGRYRVAVSGLPPGVYLHSIQSDGQNALDEPITVAADGTVVTIGLTAQPTRVLGTVRDAGRRAVPGATVIALPAATRSEATRGLHRAQETRASTSGVFTFTGLPPGDYFLVAIDDAVADGWQDPAVVTRLRPLATRVSLKDAQSVTLELRFSPFKR
jgi:protocatechuate 3,4-dioxygenase beta subunit